MNTMNIGEKTTSTVQKAMAVLGCFSVDQPILGGTEISRILGLNKVIVHRLLRDLEASGMVEQDPASRRYRLGYELLRLASIRQSGANLLRTAVPYLDALRDRTGESVHLSIMRMDCVLRLYVVQTHHFLRFSADVGDESPLHRTAAGKLLLAFSERDDWEQRIRASAARFPEHGKVDLTALKDELDAIRDQDYSIDDEGLCPLLRAFGAPVRDQAGRIVAAVSLGGVIHRIPDEKMPDMIAAITETAQNISHDLGLCEPAHTTPKKRR